MSRQELKQFFAEAEKLEMADIKEYISKKRNYLWNGSHFKITYPIGAKEGTPGTATFQYTVVYCGVNVFVVKFAGKGNYKELTIKL